MFYKPYTNSQTVAPGLSSLIVPNISNIFLNTYHLDTQCLFFLFVLQTVHFSIINLVINQLDAQNFCCTISLFRSRYMFRAHVLIIWRSKLHYTTSGIITHIGGRPVHRLREDFCQPVHETGTYMCDDTRGCVMQF